MERGNVWRDVSAKESGDRGARRTGPDSDMARIRGEFDRLRPDQVILHIMSTPNFHNVQRALGGACFSIVTSISSFGEVKAGELVREETWRRGRWKRKESLWRGSPGGGQGGSHASQASLQHRGRGDRPSGCGWRWSRMQGAQRREMPSPCVSGSECQTRSRTPRSSIQMSAG